MAVQVVVRWVGEVTSAASCISSLTGVFGPGSQEMNGGDWELYAPCRLQIQPKETRYEIRQFPSSWGVVFFHRLDKRQ